MALPNWVKEVLPSQYGEDIPLGISAAHVGMSYNGVESLKSLSGVPLGKLGVNEAYPAGHERDVLGLQTGLVRAEYPTGETL